MMNRFLLLYQMIISKYIVPINWVNDAATSKVNFNFRSDIIKNSNRSLRFDMATEMVGKRKKNNRITKQMF